MIFEADVIIQRAAPYSCVSGVTSAPTVPCAHRALLRRCSSATGGLPDRGRATSVGSVHPFKQPRHHPPSDASSWLFMLSPEGQEYDPNHSWQPRAVGCEALSCTSPPSTARLRAGVGCSQPHLSFISALWPDSELSGGRQRRGGVGVGGETGR